MWGVQGPRGAELPGPDLGQLEGASDRVLSNFVPVSCDSLVTPCDTKPCVPKDTSEAFTPGQHPHFPFCSWFMLHVQQSGPLVSRHGEQTGCLLASITRVSRSFPCFRDWLTLEMPGGRQGDERGGGGEERGADVLVEVLSSPCHLL